MHAAVQYMEGLDIAAAPHKVHFAQAEVAALALALAVGGLAASAVLKAILDVLCMQHKWCCWTCETACMHHRLHTLRMAAAGVAPPPAAMQMACVKPNTSSIEVPYLHTAPVTLTTNITQHCRCAYGPSMRAT